jgi:hypothetical protein
MGLRTVHVVYEIEQRLAESRRYEAMKDEYDQDLSWKEMEQIMKHRWLLNDDDTVEVYNRKDCTPRPDGKNVPSLRCGT